MKKYSIAVLLSFAMHANTQSLQVITDNELTALFAHSPKTRIINFWATWCKPCVEEMPLFVKANSLYGNEVEFVFVSFDWLKDTVRVKQKINDLKIPGKHYLLKVANMDALINSTDSLWGGALPVTWRLKEGVRNGHYDSFEQFDDLRGFIDNNIKKEE